MTSEVRHAGLVARRTGGLWRGLLIEGPSGAGKSDLALRLLDRGFRLVADDRTIVWVDGGRLFGRAPAPIRGRLEVRGVGILTEPALDLAEIVALVGPGIPERLPDPTPETVLGVACPRLLVEYFHASAPVVLERAFMAFDAAHKRRI